MEQVVEREELIKKYLLGSLGEEEQAEVETRLLTEKDYFDELLLVEGELTDDFVFGKLSEDEAAKVRDISLVIPEWQQNLKYAEVLEQFVAQAGVTRHFRASGHAAEPRPESGTDAAWERALAEAQENRYLMSTLMDDGWVGLRLLATVKSSPQRKPEMAAETGVDEDALTPVLIRLIECGVIEEQGGVFFCTGMGAEVLEKMEGAAGASLVA